MAQKRALLEAVAYNLRVFLTFPLPLPWILKVFFPPARKTSHLCIDIRRHLVHHGTFRELTPLSFYEHLED